MNEAETRAEHIAPALNVAGWGVVEGKEGRFGTAQALEKRLSLAAPSPPHSSEVPYQQLVHS